MNIVKLISFCIVLFCLSCQVAHNVVLPEGAGASNTDDGKIDFQFFHINDTYLLNPLEGGTKGGFARAATIRAQAIAENENTLSVHAGDFLNPSLMGTLPYEGKKIKGRQMVEVLNEMIDVMAFGNHEFDLDEEVLQERLNESTFTWLGTNVLHQVDSLPRPFHKNQNNKKHYCPETYIWEISDADGTTAKIGIFSALVNMVEKKYIYYEDYYEEAVKAYLELACQTDVVVGLTHLERLQDLKLASMLPNVPLLMGGHDHDNMMDTIGTVVLAKADANVKSAYIHRFQLDKNTGTISLQSELKEITDKIEDEPKIAAIVEKWNRILNTAISKIVAEPTKVIHHANPPLDGLEKHIRHQQTNLGELVTNAMIAASGDVDGSIINSGSIRIDDRLTGDITAIDIFSALPYGGPINIITIKGKTLIRVLDIGVKNKGTGGYLQRGNIQKVGNKWQIGGQAIANDKNYQIAISSYLMKGLETRLGFLTKDHPDISKMEVPTEGDRMDIRKAIITYLSK